MVGQLGQRNGLPVYGEWLMQNGRVALYSEALCTFDGEPLPPSLEATSAPLPPPRVPPGWEPGPAPIAPALKVSTAGMFDDLIPTQPPGAFSVPFMGGGMEGVHTVHVTLASTELAMEIDTGSDTIAISPGLARRLVERGEATLDGTTVVALADGALKTVNVLVIHRLAIGGHVLTDVEATDSGTDAMPLLGMSALKRFGKISLDLDKRRLTLE